MNIEPGDTLKWTHPDTYPNVTMGKEYECKKTYVIDGVLWVTIEDDNGSPAQFYGYRFNLVSKAVTMLTTKEAIEKELGDDFIHCTYKGETVVNLANQVLEDMQEKLDDNAFGWVQKCNEITAERNKLQAEVDKKQKTIDDLLETGSSKLSIKQNQELQDEVDTLKEDVQTWVSAAKSWKVIAETVKNILATCSENYEIAKVSMTNLQAEVDRLKEELATAKHLNDVFRKRMYGKSKLNEITDGTLDNFKLVQSSALATCKADTLREVLVWFNSDMDKHSFKNKIQSLIDNPTKDSGISIAIQIWRTRLGQIEAIKVPEDKHKADSITEMRYVAGYTLLKTINTIIDNPTNDKV